MRFGDEADAEFAEALAWYAGRSVRAADGFRSAVVGRYPYSLIFRELAAEVQIVAVAHEPRRPGYWVCRV